MRILLLLLLMLTLLPPPFSEVAVVNCCEPVAEVQVLHDQHHQPNHVTENDGTGGQPGVAPAFDLDCGTCHANCAAAMTTAVLPEFDRAGLDRLEPPSGHRLPTWPERPYRPQWSSPIGSGWSAFA